MFQMVLYLLLSCVAWQTRGSHSLTRIAHSRIVGKISCAAVYCRRKKINLCFGLGMKQKKKRKQKEGLLDKSMQVIDAV